MKNIYFNKTFLLISLFLSLCACTSASNQTAEKFQPAINVTPAQTKTITRYKPIAVTGQLMPLKYSLRKYNHSKHLTGAAAIKAANKKAIKQPTSSGYINSIMTFDYMPGALYQIYCAPLSVTDIEFQNGEHIVSVAAGDTLRWEVSKTYSGSGSFRKEHLLIKPTDSELSDSVVVMTDQRTYHLQLHSTPSTYMASVKWRYPQGNGLLENFIDSKNNEAQTQTAGINSKINVNQLDFQYEIKLISGAMPTWMPTMVFNDGSKTYIKFPSYMQQAPTLFIGNNAKNEQVVNYRVRGNYYIIDGLFADAQLRIGQKHPTIVQINYRG